MNETFQAVAQAATGPESEGFNWDSALPALIGFTGVLFGGLINVAAQRRNFNEEQVAIIRERVAELSVVVLECTTAAKQAHDTLSKHAAEPDEQDVITLDEHGHRLFTLVGKEFHELYRKAIVLSIRLMSARDKKVADQAQVVQDSLAEFNSAVSGLFEYRLNQSSSSLNDACDKLIRTGNQMLSMIEPRRFESFIRIRTIEQATKVLDKEIKKQDDAEGIQANETAP